MRYGSLKFWKLRTVDRYGIPQWHCYNTSGSLLARIADLIGKRPLAMRIVTRSGYHVELVKPMRKNLNEIRCIVRCLETSLS